MTPCSSRSVGSWHQHPPPHHRADPEQPNLDLHNLALGGVGRRRGSSNDRSGRLRRSRHLFSLCSIAPRRRGHPTLPDALPHSQPHTGRSISRPGTRRSLRQAQENATRPTGIRQRTRPRREIHQRRHQDVQRPPSHHLSPPRRIKALCCFSVPLSCTGHTSRDFHASLIPYSPSIDCGAPVPLGLGVLALATPLHNATVGPQ